MPRTAPPPLDPLALERLALRYVERYATTTGKLADYLRRKLRERGGEGDPAGVAARMAALGYVDDRGFAEAKAEALARRGYGPRRAAAALSAARVSAADRAAAIDDTPAARLAAATAYARRRRLGPFAAVPADPETRRRHAAALIRAGHAPMLAARVAAARDPCELDDDAL